MEKKDPSTFPKPLVKPGEPLGVPGLSRMARAERPGRTRVSKDYKRLSGDEQRLADLCSSEDGSIEDMEALLDSGTSPDFKLADGSRPIILAAGAGRADAVDLLIRKGAGAAVADDSGWSALHAAVDAGHVGIVSVLVDAGADLQARNGAGWRPCDILEALDCQIDLRPEPAAAPAP